MSFNACLLSIIKKKRASPGEGGWFRMGWFSWKNSFGFLFVIFFLLKCTYIDYLPIGFDGERFLGGEEPFGLTFFF